MNIKTAMEVTGFAKCEFKPDDDPCDKCDKPKRQLYYRRTDYWENEGEYFCAKCVIEYAKEIDSIVDIECPQCGDIYQGWPNQYGGVCFDCYVCDSYRKNELAPLAHNPIDGE